MSEQKMGTHYVREICENFRGIAEKTSVDALKEKLTGLAGQLEPLATKLYFKTQKGNEEMEKAAKEVEEMKDKLVIKSYLKFYYDLIFKLTDLVKNIEK